MIRSILAAAAALATMTSSAAAASTLRLFDVDAQLGQRLVADAFFAQTIARMEKSDLVRPIDIQVDDDGRQRHDSVVIGRRPSAALPLRLPGVRVLEGERRVDITTQLAGGVLGYDLTLSESNGFDDNVTPANDVGRTSVHLYGQEPVTAEGKPVFARTYDQGRRMLIGQMLR